ncbi:hypothetical protein FIBSPDRAFT_799760 [Athelia psychrophila]|uniref:BTB domain-containing protein n=1 Tax=Athelia psychrophila TaxID=1759441 RepID=A0A167UQZ1_9AGAM|nr:hypothetical protein FIBSPDRAFT_1054848 [Fibularhizoctonia sp. CBS 109695]KZP11920.1 hypothetical protein FIBSPDRAFT_799760 [Fibularhizoctonia sp. CBS 109695]
MASGGDGNDVARAQSITSDRFCAQDADVTFESCDHVLFRVHRKNLEITSEGFSPPSGTITSNDSVQLSERAEILDLLFQYTYPQRPPDLTLIRFEVFADLAEAAEKYQMFGAMEICRMAMKAAYNDHSFEVLLYSTRHGYPELMTLAQGRALELSTADAFRLFPPTCYIAYTRYQAQWTEIVKFASNRIQATPPCEYHTNYVLGFYKRLIANPALLLDLDTLLAGSSSGCLNRACSAPTMREAMEKKIRNMKSFGSFL